MLLIKKKKTTTCSSALPPVSSTEKAWSRESTQTLKGEPEVSGAKRCIKIRDVRTRTWESKQHSCYRPQKLGHLTHQLGHWLGNTGVVFCKGPQNFLAGIWVPLVARRYNTINCSMCRDPRFLIFLTVKKTSKVKTKACIYQSLPTVLAPLQMLDKCPLNKQMNKLQITTHAEWTGTRSLQSQVI